jgi:serine/threonine protein kinase
MPLQAGASLGRYVIESPLGAGGMGEVYLAEDTGLHRRVALKLLPNVLAADDIARKRPLMVAPVPLGQTFPEFPADDRPAFEVWATLPGAEAVERDNFVPSTDPTTFVFTKADELRNLFRIPLAGR